MARIVKPPLAQPVKHLEVDVRGRKGTDATNGTDGSNGFGSGADGTDGTHATQATPGQRGGDIDLELKVQQAGDAYSLEAKVRKNDAAGNATQAGEFLPSGSDVNLFAGGGGGGKGGIGGDGGDGATGTSGSNASESSEADDGGPGGDGGDAGSGTSGAGGGQGGRIRVRVSEADTDALAAVKQMDVEGGKGGLKGKHGDAGSGGSGGSGGSSYSGTVDDGDGKSHTVSRSSGSSGRSGSSGSSAYGSLDDGRDGAKGSATIEVVGNGGVEQFADRYRLGTTGTRLTEANGDGIFEPGEQAKVDVGYQNRGPMKSPSGPLSAQVGDGQWVKDGDAQRLPANLAPGAGAQLQGIGFTVAPDAQTHVGDALNAQTNVQTSVIAERPGAVLDESKYATPVKVSYPVEISAIVGERTATRERPASVAWEVKNVSTKALGSESDSHRLVDSMLKMTGGDVAAEHLVFTGADGRPVSLTEGIGAAIANLAPGRSVKISGTISFADGAPFYSQVKLGALLDLGKLDAPDQAKAIQQREFSVQLAKTYANDPDSGLLVVINNRTTKEEIAAWEGLAKDMGTQANLWNISLYGGVSLTQAVNDTELGPAFAKKTVVILNNPYDPEKGIDSPIGHLGEKDLLLAACRNRTSTYVVGGNVDIQKQLFPDVGGEAKAFGNRKEHRAAVGQHQAGSDATLGADQVALSALGKPTKEKLEKAAAKVVDALQRENPDRRYYADTDFKPGAPDTSLFSFMKTHEVGSVTVRRGADVAANVVLHQASNDVHATGFVQGAQNRYAVAKALSMPLKLQSLERLAQSGSPNAPVVAKAILSDLAEEQQGLRDRAWNGEVSREEIATKLTDLQQLAERFSGVDPGSGLGKAVLDLAAEVAHMTEQSKTLFDKLLPMRRRSSLDAVSDQLLETMLKKAFGDPQPKAVKDGLKARIAELKTRDASLSDDQRMKMTPYLQPAQLWSSEMTSDFDVWARARA